ncbi:MAG: hypothetical protein II225_00170 [Ruminococcus sp.]|nr:hypothetical protein [Ruminococcus sp.]
MRSIVFSFTRRRRRHGRQKRDYSFEGASQFFRKYGSAVFFTFMFAGGMLMGSLSAGSADSLILEKLDFLFTTNLSTRLSQPAFSTFSASFASGFVFTFFVFLCGLSPWGMGVIWISPAFKGFGTGLSAGYLFVTYGFKGVGFYLLVILLGTFILSFALIIECIQASRLSLKIARFVFASGENIKPVSVSVRTYLFRSLYILVITAGSALADMLLWTLFSGLFF